jgi:glycine hydroxymethyltransferase
VRVKAGLFDVSHMGLFEFSGENVHLFLNTIAANDVSLIAPGESQYSFLLAEDGRVVDDVWIYRLEDARYWMVVNASNNDKDWAWIEAVRRGEAQIDPARPWARALGTETVHVRDLRDPGCGPEMRGQLALQGPASRDVLLDMLPAGSPEHDRIAAMERNQIIRCDAAGFDLYLARTGYTGEPVAFEIFVHPDRLADFWAAVLKAGEKRGVQPIGLAARDSLRIEAGLPLYGHELAGPLGLNPSDAGFAPYVKLHKPFFIGKQAYLAHERERSSRLMRFALDEERAPMLNPGDVIVNRKGRVVGAVTSCSIDSAGRLTGLGYVQEPHHERGTPLSVFRLSDRNWETHALNELKPGDRLQLPLDITVIARFLNKKG